jgi:integral membrane protein (TIGR01906 family)
MKIKHAFLIILIPIVIILLNFSMLAFDDNYYKKQFEKNNIYEKIPQEQADNQAENLINYLKQGKELKGNFFNEKEKQHLIDVRTIIKRLIGLLYLSLLAAAIIITIGFIQNKKQLGIALIAGGLLTTLTLILLFLSMTNFEWVFIKFHEIAFTNNLWILDPATDKLIVMFPESFFYAITKDIGIRSVITAAATTLVGLTLILAEKIKRKHQTQI